MRTLVVDDEMLARRRLKALLADEPQMDVVGEAANGRAAIKAILEKRPELVLLDVQMPGLNGFEVLRELAAYGVAPPAIVFVTAHDEYAIRAFDVEAVDYVLKPVTEERLRTAVHRAIARLRERPPAELQGALRQLLERVGAMDTAPSRIPVKHDGRVTFVDVGDIDWVDADRDLVRIHTGGAVHVVRSTMDEVSARLGSGFLRIHRSSIVNTARIREIQPWFKGDYVVLMKDGTKLRSGRTYRAGVQALLRG